MIYHGREAGDTWECTAPHGHDGDGFPDDGLDCHPGLDPEPPDPVPLQVGSLFTGIGGLDLGFEAAGFQTAWQVEWDPFCTHILEKNWPTTKRYTDVTAIDWTRVAPVDILIGGFPCQPVSEAGRGLGAADPRWLWPEFERAIRGLGPEYVVVENVPGLTNRGLDTVLGSMATLGYDAEWDIISAADVGARHLRKRLFIVAYTRSPRRRERGRAWQDGDGDSRLDPGHQLAASGPDVADSDGQGPQRRGRQHPVWSSAGKWAARASRRAQSGIWQSEPDVGRVANGVPARVDRLRALGNAVVPEVAEVVADVLAEAIARRYGEFG